MKTPTANKLPSGSWRCQVMVDGVSRSVTAPTEAEAIAEAMMIKARRNNSPRQNKSDRTVGEAVDAYIDLKAPVLSPSTVASYRRYRTHELETICDVKVRQVSQDRVQRLVNKLVKDGYSPKTVRNAHGLLSAVLARERPDLRLMTAMPQKRKYEASVPSDGDIRAIIEEARGTSHELPIMLAIWLGLRMSEILGLEYGDIDGDRIHIRRALVDDGEKSTKTYSSQRTLPLPPYLRGLIGSGVRNAKIVTESRRVIGYHFGQICKKAGVQHYRFHDLRHINASVMLALGVPDKYAMERMGHATNNMLKTVYQHTMTDEARSFSDAVDGYFNSIVQT